MKVRVYILLAGMGLLVSCAAQEQKALSQGEINAKVDSILVIKKEEVARLAEDDLDRRITIDVKVKADSLFRICREKGTLEPTPAPPAQP